MREKIDFCEKLELDHAELFYKFSLTISTIVLYKDMGLKYYEQFSFLKYVVDKKDMELTKVQEKRGASMLELGIYIIALQMNKVLEDEWGEEDLKVKIKRFKAYHKR